MSTVVIDSSRASAPHCSVPDRSTAPAKKAHGLDPAVVAAREAGRVAGQRLARTPLTPRQRAAVAAVMGGAR
ncbi:MULTISPECIES: hypothetical protein [Actinomycetes]|uniref:Uncharacterized protein n=1 Tax=Leucobacter denitrificans TaxID=683042 RepID=A0A7G9S709_9MICO|nr:MULTISPECIES: hypothetical protein [Actinomycetes]QNN63634.1 hypothetical protein H9L06_04855 [Leucobacter denitrificans]HHX88534.1 hypothetical protein [Paracoccus sp. (in: a-proteobacteria)]